MHETSVTQFLQKVKLTGAQGLRITSQILTRLTDRETGCYELVPSSLVVKVTSYGLVPRETVLKYSSYWSTASPQLHGPKAKPNSASKLKALRGVVLLDLVLVPSRYLARYSYE